VFPNGLPCRCTGIVLAPCGRNGHLQDGLAVEFDLAHILVAQQIHADLVAAVQQIEKIGTHLPDVGNPFDRKRPTRFPHAQQNHAAMGVSEGAVGGPEIAGNRPFAIGTQREFGFQLDRFAQTKTPGEGGHGVLLRATDELSLRVAMGQMEHRTVKDC